ncbi:MAG TPA: hypothetical protein VD769_10070 [Gaiellaceae bacterium]|nr:hypothetical protein [Gaiellaceae bacterium]
MSWLRSRWTVVALVPAFFLAGFGIVSALAGGSDDSEPAAAPGSSTAEPGGPRVVTVYQETLPADTAGEGETEGADPTTTAGGGSTTGNGNGNGDGNGGGGGGAPPAPPPGVIEVDYGRWDGVFELANSAIVPEFGIASVVGELSYLGGVDCPVGLVRVRFWFYSERGQPVGRGVWESTQSTGDGGEVTGREPLPFEAYGPSSEAPGSAVLRFIAVECL